MKKYYLLLLCCCLMLAARAQKITGTLLDSVAQQPIAAATITLLKQKDSSLVSFTMSDPKGHFEFTGVAPGAYRLLVTHVKYHSSARELRITADRADVHLPPIQLYDINKTLKEVVVNAEAPPVTLLGDTVQYNAGSFKTIPNASVEQLLKKMPGIQVGKDGTVKAQGQKVKRILVDGKEFFGNDPKIATKNLPADAVDKVQVYDKMSDAAQLTGFDDGNSEKTINLKLKENKKKGRFGKATVGGGSHERYEGRFNLNDFKGNRQLSAIGLANNTNAEGFSFMDLMNFNGELSRLQQSGAASFTVGSDDAAGMFMNGGNNNGFKTIMGGGINYNNLIGKKTDFTGNYFFNHYQPEQESDIQRQYFLPDSSYLYQQHNNSRQRNNTHRANANANIMIDSSQSLKISAAGGYQENNSRNESAYKTWGGNQTLANEGFSNSTSSGTGSNMSSDILYRKKFARNGRTFSLGLQTSFNNSSSSGTLLSVNHFYQRKPDEDSIYQQNNSHGSMKNYTARAVYTEPLFKRSLMEFSVGKSYTYNKADKTTYDYDPLTGRFDQLNAALTNNFENSYGYTNAGLRLRTKRKKFGMAIGLQWQQASLEGKIIAGKKDSVIRKTFNNLLPSLRFKYDFTRYRNLSINYTAITNQPGISQLQPVPDITDPLNIREGNPYLKQELSHMAQVSFMSIDPFRNKHLFAFFNVQETQHKIVDYDIVDSSGIRHTRPVNVNGVYNITGTVSLSLPLRIVPGNIEISSNMGYSKMKQFINTISNQINTFSCGPGVRFDLHPTNSLDVSFSAGGNYYRTAYSLQTALNTGYFSQQYEGEVNWQLPAKYYFSSSFTYMVNSRRADGFNSQVPLWNASLSKQFLHFNRGELKLSAVDLLNRNVGISRSTNQNYIEDSRIRNLQRFFQLSFTYSLSKTGLTAAAGSVRGLKMIH
ncbi:MAG: outer membrane beta-barrel protein [Chitinophaga sp.]|uniref:outer membrane beta-barrel family protein n=1 Tax=Chitinophaga sp. TaxID=1869181 RepID=UPI001B0F92BC|nr:outer membrane beta-barrel family protein [Chitinophaga sp.]MBO9728711.1 outer membrane beta-barrel protein [Chitinophaga sp.]